MGKQPQGGAGHRKPGGGPKQRGKPTKTLGKQKSTKGKIRDLERLLKKVGRRPACSTAARLAWSTRQGHSMANLPGLGAPAKAAAHRPWALPPPLPACCRPPPALPCHPQPPSKSGLPALPSHHPAGLGSQDAGAARGQAGGAASGIHGAGTQGAGAQIRCALPQGGWAAAAGHRVLQDTGGAGWKLHMRC